MEPDPPDCIGDYVATRTLGTCVDSSNPADSCTEGTHKTRHIIMYMPWIDPFWDTFCFGEYMACMGLIPPNPLIDCWDDIYQPCLDSHTECISIGSFYDTPETGCVGS